MMLGTVVIFKQLAVTAILVISGILGMLVIPGLLRLLGCKGY
jgi:hypothetical protein